MKIHRLFKCKIWGEWSIWINISLSRLKTLILMIIHSSWQLKILRPFKCKMCGKVFGSTFSFDGSRLEFHSWIYPANLTLWTTIGHSDVRCVVSIWINISLSRLHFYPNIHQHFALMDQDLKCLNNILTV